MSRAATSELRQQDGPTRSVGSSGGFGSGKLEMPEAVRKQYNEMLAWINDNMTTQSLLYDLNRLPEQLKEGSREWREMLLIVQHVKAAYDEGKSSLPNAEIRHEPPSADEP